ncbi:hypothetical protein, partial [Streptomyces sp. NPDC060194]|uniref:hypothetical protein n=1 Tax=Streptomyces sp. NPDC060194 TaxID=3347069 RepID=UPI003664FAF8
AREALGPDRPGGAPRAAVKVSAQDATARVRIALDLGFPSDIGGQCAAVRRHVTERVRALAGMDVPEVVVTVERLQHTGARRGWQGRTR